MTKKKALHLATPGGVPAGIKIDTTKFTDEAAVEDYMHVVINKSDFKLTHIQYRSGPLEGQTYPFTNFSRTCRKQWDCKKCSEEGAYEAFLVDTCDASDEMVRLRAVNSSGQVGWTDEFKLHHDCNFNGAVYCINDDG